jgi:hypothetical protein
MRYSKKRFVQDVAAILDGFDSKKYCTSGFTFGLARPSGDEWRIFVDFVERVVIASIHDDCSEEELGVIMFPWPGTDPAEVAKAIQSVQEPPLPKWGKRRRPSYRSIDAPWSAS